MDILCTRCGEPWDIASLTDDMTPEEAKDLKAGKGCPCCSGKDVCTIKNDCDSCPEQGSMGYCLANRFKPRADDARHIQSELAAVLGDDIDGLAGLMEDFNLL